MWTKGIQSLWSKTKPTDSKDDFRCMETLRELSGFTEMIKVDTATRWNHSYLWIMTITVVTSVQSNERISEKCGCRWTRSSVLGLIFHNQLPSDILHLMISARPHTNSHTAALISFFPSSDGETRLTRKRTWKLLMGRSNVKSLRSQFCTCACRVLRMEQWELAGGKNVGVSFTDWCTSSCPCWAWIPCCSHRWRCLARWHRSAHSRVFPRRTGQWLPRHTHTHTVISLFQLRAKQSPASRPCCSISLFYFVLFFKEMTLTEDARLASEAVTALRWGWRSLAASQIWVPTFYWIQPPEVSFRKTMNNDNFPHFILKHL